MAANSKTRFFFSIVLVVVVIGAFVMVRNHHTHSPVSTTTTPAQKQSGSFNKQAHSLTDPNSIWVIVNKQHPLNPPTYKPADLRLPHVSQRIPGAEQMQMRDVAATALEKMFAAAKAHNLNLQVTTAYRGYDYQKMLYTGYVASQGQSQADALSARPGFSEHQTGLAADLRPQSGKCYLVACFGSTPEGVWLASNAYRYGFIIRYPKDKTAITGYDYEPWHVRYVGTDLSNEMHRKHIETLEEFFNVSGGSTYVNQ